MPVFSVDVRLCATAYVRASTKKEAEERVKAFMNDTFEFTGEQVSELPYDSPRLPEISLSPAMTGHGIWPSAKIEEV